MKDWKTTSSGIVLIVGAIVTIVYSAVSGTVTQVEIMAAVGAVVTGIGLLFAKDATSTPTTPTV